MAGDYAARCRKGTKSCSECRRRKVRCIRIPEDAPACRKCEERGTECTAQIYISSGQSPRLSSRYRIYQLESQLAGLTERMRDVEARLGCQTTQSLDYPVAESPGRESSDDDSNASDLLAVDQPSHLHSLFHNDWLRVDSRQKTRNLQDCREVQSAPLLDNARRALQRLIPPKDEIVEIMKSGSEWLTMVHVLFAQPFTAGSEQEILDSYDQMCNPAVDTISLASWLLVIAITAQQVSRAHESTSPGSRSYGTQLRLSRAISDTVEEKILPHDRLIGTTHGLAMFVHFIRLQIGQGKFQKAWIRLRHVIAIAELMGLPKSFQTAQFNKSTKTDDSESQLGGAQIWELISTADRLLGLIINIPPDTNRYNHTKHQPLAINGVIQPAVYFKRLTDIAGKIHRLDDLDMTHQFDSEVYASALELCRELRELASETPQSWWIRDGNRVEPDHIVQLMHYYILVRIHLPFILSQHSGEEYLYSRLACMDACEAVLQRYLVLRRILPPGFVLCAMLDLHAFTAAVLVLLVSHSSPPSTGRFNLHIDKVRIHTEVEQVINLMRERSDGTSESHFSQDGVTTLSSLNHHLQDENVAAGLELTLNVPLLGSVHVRRSPPQVANIDSWRSQVPSDLGLLKSNQPSLLPTSHENNSVMTDQGGQEERRWDNISWSIEDNESFFQDFLMTDDWGHFSM